MNDDLISRQAAIDELRKCQTYLLYEGDDEPKIERSDAEEVIMHLPAVQPEWDNHTVACLLAEIFDDNCACNYNGIDEWLPEKCELLDSCPNSIGVSCWEQFLKHKAGRRKENR